MFYFGFMDASDVIEAIKRLPPDEQSQVIQFAVELARNRKLTAGELTNLAERMAACKDPDEEMRLRAA